MRPRLTRVALAAATGLLVLICSLSATIAASAHSGPRRVGTAPLFPRGARSLGALPETTKIPVDITLDPSDPAALSAYARAVSTPGSPDYHHFLTVAQFRQRFAPSDSEIATVRAGLEAAGLDPGPVSANGLLLQVRAPASQLAAAFDTSFEQVQLASGRVAYANTSAPRLSASLSNLVQGVVGLNNLVLPHALGIQAARPVGHARASATPGGTSRASASVTDCPSADALATSSGPYTDQNIASTYGFSSLYAAGDEGAGQSVGLLELEPFTRSDIHAYNTCYGINGGSTSDVVTINVSDGSSSGASGPQVGEAALDIEQVLGLAPAATVDVYSAPNDVQGVINAYTEMVQSSVSVISTSWGECEAAIGSATAQAEQTLFQEAATEGKSVYAAAGDDGSNDCDYTSSPNPSALAVDDPGSDPYVTSVGGTSLSSADPASQTVWNDSYGAGGGGVSALWTMPTYQGGASASLGVISSASSTSSCAAATGSTGAYCRQVPDVSADADPATGYVIYYKGAWTAYGGTSAAVPLWAALTALANASSACSAGPVGFVNPVLYSLAGNASAYANDFTDVTSGNNDFTPSGYTGGEFSAGDGYDMASGLGTPKGTSLIPALCGVADGGGGTSTTVTETVTTGTTTTVTQTVTTGTTTTVTEPGTTTTVTAPGTTTTVTAPGTTTTVTAPGMTTTVAGPVTTSTVTKILTVPGPTQTVYYAEPSQTVTRTVTVTVTASATPKVTVTKPKAGQTAVAVGLSCPSGGTACAVTGSLTAAEAVKSLRSARSRDHLTGKARGGLARARTVTLASAHLTVAAGRQATLKLSLDAAGKLMLKRAKKLTLTLHLTSDGTTLATHSVAFTAAKT